MTREELEKHVGPVYVLRDGKAEAATYRMLDMDGLCAVVFSDNAIGWRPARDIYSTRMELLVAWELALVGLRNRVGAEIAGCHSQMWAEKARVKSENG